MIRIPLIEDEKGKGRLANPCDLPEKLRQMIAQNNTFWDEDDSQFMAGIFSGRIEAFSYVLELLGEDE